MMAIMYTAEAQLKAGTIKLGNKDGTVTTSGPVNDGQMNETWTSEFKDKDGITFRRVTYKKDLKGDWTFSSEDLTPGGRVLETWEGKVDLSGGLFRVSKYTHRKYNKSGKPTSQETAEMGTNGRMHVKDGLDNATKNEYDLADDEMTFPNELLLYPMRHSDRTEVSLNPDKSNVNYASGKGENCGEKFFVSLGPSYLSRDFGDEKKSAWGVQLVANYNFNKHISAGVDLSTYSTKIGDEKLTTSFYLLDGVYTFGKGSQECPPHVSVFGRILIGMMHEKFAGGSGSGPAYGAGVGSDYRFSNRFSIGVGFDYLRGKFEDESVSNVRGSVLVTFRFGHVAPV